MLKRFVQWLRMMKNAAHTKREWMIYTDCVTINGRRATPSEEAQIRKLFDEMSSHLDAMSANLDKFKNVHNRH